MKILSVPVLVGCIAGLPAQTEGWQLVNTPFAPVSRDRMTFDAARGVSLIFGGLTNQETWTYNGIAWQMQSPAHIPPSRLGHFLGYDPVRQRVLLYGGSANSTALDDTWEWDGSDWELVGSGADARFNGAIAFDPVRQQMLRFGGNGPNGPHAESRAWSGSQWLLLSTGGPAAREGATMVTDTLRNRVILYGGYGPQGGSGGRFNDTWEWNGSVWAQHLSATTPPHLSGPSMAFHAAKGWVILGNGDMPFGTPNTDVYAWDGFDWSLRSLSIHPPPGPYAYDSIRDRVVTIGAGQTWEYTAPAGVPAAFRTFGTGCAGSGGVPTLGAALGELPFVGYPLQITIANLSASPFLLPFGVAGFSNAMWNGMPLPIDLGFLGFAGCNAYIDAVVYETLYNQAGTARWTIQIPNDGSFVGLAMFLQGFVLDGGAPGGGVVTNAASLIIGRR